MKKSIKLFSFQVLWFILGVYFITSLISTLFSIPALFGELDSFIVGLFFGKIIITIILYFGFRYFAKKIQIIKTEN